MVSVPIINTLVLALLSNLHHGSAVLIKRTFRGDGTFFAPGLGACGITNAPTDFVAALVNVANSFLVPNGKERVVECQ
jgi:hypothetical protein